MQFFENMRAGIVADLAAFHPNSWTDVENALKEMAEIQQAYGAGHRDLGVRLGPDRKPYVAAFGEVVSDLSKHNDALAQQLMEALGVVESAHSAELQRIRAPRPSEEDFDVSRNRG